MAGVFGYLQLNMKKHRATILVTIASFLFLILFITMLLTSQSSLFFFRYLDAEPYGRLYSVYLTEEKQQELTERGGLVYPVEYGQQNGVKINLVGTELAKLLRVPLRRGSWFDVDATEEQAVVNFNLSKKYELGKYYNISFPSGIHRVKVVGYLDIEGYGIGPNANFCQGFTRNEGMLVCTRNGLASTNVYALLPTENAEDLMPLMNGQSSLRDGYLEEVKSSKDVNFLYFYLALAVAALISMLVLQSAVINGDVWKRRQAVAVMCGATKRQILLAELIKRTLILAASVLIAFLFACLMEFVFPNDLFPVALNRMGYGVLAAVVAAVLMTGADVLAVRKLDLLKTLKRS